MSETQKTGKSFSFYGLIALTLFLLLSGLGTAYMFVTLSAAKVYVKDINQQLYRDVAQHLVKETQPIKQGLPDTAATHDIMHSMMVINPSVEVYLLDTNGLIIDYVVPYTDVHLDRVDMGPIHAFLQDETGQLIVGDDPKAPGQSNIFSAAPIEENGRVQAYAYVILAGEQQKNISSQLAENYVLSLGGKLFYLILLATLLIGLAVFWLLTRRLRRVIAVFQRFKEGDLSARISLSRQGDLQLLGGTFNEMADRINENIEQLQSVDRLRQELVANVSHDLRTPLAIIQGYVETLLMKSKDLSKEEQRKHLNTVMASAHQLSRLIDQLFEYSKLEAQQVVAEKEAFYLQELCQDIVFKYQILATEQNIHLRWEAEKTLPMVFADIALVERVFQNLLDNALHHTPSDGEVVVSLFDSALGVEVRVSDTGPGIPADQQSLIFERHRQIGKNNSPAKAYGAGLGLAIVKKILEIHQTSISVNNRPTRGAEFCFKLPLATVK